MAGAASLFLTFSRDGARPKPPPTFSRATRQKARCGNRGRSAVGSGKAATASSWAPTFSEKSARNNCLLEPGDRSHCRNRVNDDGTLYTLVYGNPCTFHVDPVEKKPLYRFPPGTQTFSLATSGCVFRCLNCQNWEISQKKPEETKNPQGDEFRLAPPLAPSLTQDQMSRLSLFPEDVVAVTEALGCPSISYTYTEPTAFFEYTQDTCKAARERKLKNIVVSCGSIEERPARDLYQYVDAAHVDLKGFDDDIYRKLNAGKLAPILRTLKVLRELAVGVEVINLLGAD